MKSTTEQLPAEFQMQIIICILASKEFLSEIIDLLKVEYFDVSYLQQIASVMLDLFTQGHPIDKFTVKTLALEKAPVKDRDIIITILDQAVVSDKNVGFVKDKFVEFATHQELKLAIAKSTVLLNQWKHTEIRDVMGALSAKLSPNVFQDYFATSKKRALDRTTAGESVYTKTLIPALDNVIQGLFREQLGVWLGRPGGGKSVALRHCAKAAALLGQTVLYYTLELSSAISMDCFDASITGITMRDLRDSTSDVIKLMEDYSETYTGDIFVAQYPARELNATIIKGHCQRFAALGRAPHVIVVDYGDLMSSAKVYTSRYDELEAVYEELRGVAQTYKIAVFTASQANRASLAKEVITMADIADSWGKCKVADWIVALCQTPAERADNRGRFFTAKNRNGPEGVSVPFFCDFSRSLFLTFPEGR